MDFEYTSIGETVRALRKAKGMTKAELSEKAGISESHVSKIEMGTRHPGFDTCQKIMGVFSAVLVVRSKEDSIREKCVLKAQSILMNSTESQAIYLTKILECMSENMDMISS